MIVTVKEIKDELAARIVICNGISSEGYANGEVKRRMRAKIVTLRGVLSWITGQEQLPEDPRIEALAEEILEGPGSMS